MSRPFRPRKAPTIIAFFMLATLIALGVWQVQRLAWKTDLVTKIEARTEAAPTALPAVLPDPENWEYRAVLLRGTYLHDHEILLIPRVYEGRAGAHLLTPLQREDGGIVYINRGWLTPEVLPKVARPQGTVLLRGLVRLPHKNTFTPENIPAKNEWYWPDLPAMAQAAGLNNPAPILIDLAASTNDAYPISGQTRLDIPNNHRQYAAFWFCMALVLCAIWAVSSLTGDSE